MSNKVTETAHDVKTWTQAKEVLSESLSGDTKGLQKELAGMTPQQQQAVLKEAQKLEKSREAGHENDPNFPRVQFYDTDANGKPVPLNGKGPINDIAVTGFGQHATVWGPDLPQQEIGKAYYDNHVAAAAAAAAVAGAGGKPASKGEGINPPSKGEITPTVQGYPEVPVPGTAMAPTLFQIEQQQQKEHQAKHSA